MREIISLKKMLVMSWVYMLVLVLGSWMASSWSFAWGVMVGGLISVVSFYVSYRDMMLFFDTLTTDKEPATEKDIVKKSKKGFILKFWLRIVLIGIVLLFFIRWGKINIFGLILGLTTVVFTITFTALGVVWKYYFSRR